VCVDVPPLQVTAAARPRLTASGGSSEALPDLKVAGRHDFAVFGSDPAATLRKAHAQRCAIPGSRVAVTEGEAGICLPDAFAECKRLFEPWRRTGENMQYGRGGLYSFPRGPPGLDQDKGNFNLRLCREGWIQKGRDNKHKMKGTGGLRPGPAPARSPTNLRI